MRRTQAWLELSFASFVCVFCKASFVRFNWLPHWLLAWQGRQAKGSDNPLAWQPQKQGGSLKNKINMTNSLESKCSSSSWALSWALCTQQPGLPPRSQWTEGVDHVSRQSTQSLLGTPNQSGTAKVLVFCRNKTLKKKVVVLNKKVKWVKTRFKKKHIWNTKSHNWESHNWEINLQ